MSGVRREPSLARSARGVRGDAHQQLSQDLLIWFRKARAAGLDSDSIDGIYQQTVRSALQEEAV